MIMHFFLFTIPYALYQQEQLASWDTGVTSLCMHI